MSESSERPGRQLLRERLAARAQARVELDAAIARMAAPKPDNTLLFYAGVMGAGLGWIVGFVVGVLI